MNNDFWMPKPPRKIGDGELAPSNSSISEAKSSHQWFMDGAETVLHPNKRQAVEIHPNSYTALLNSNIYNGNSSSFHSVAGQFTERLFDDETPKTTNFDDGNLPSIAIGSLSMGRKVFTDPFGIDSTFGLSMSHSLVEPQSGDGYSKAEDESVTVGSSFDRVNDGVIAMADTFNRVVNSYIPMCEPYRDNNGSIPVGPAAIKDNGSVTTIAQSLIKEDKSHISMDAFNVHDNALSMDHVFGKEVVDFRMSMNKTDNGGLSTRHSFGKGENNIISFAGLNDGPDNFNSSGKLVCNYDFLMGQPSVQRLEDTGLSEYTSDSFVSVVQVTNPGETISKKREQKATKKTPPNNFPSNVRSLLSTGMLDGVSVKYVAWSREKELRGVIKGTSYLCGCQSCTFSKAINAFEFERHAGCKTKHPNNHIYFDNGKTIYGVVQELRNTPQNVLFEVIQTITGSPINQKSFRLWKDSFLAATRELHRIYGKEEGTIVS